MPNGQNIIGDAANECAISVDPTNLNHMTIGWRQFNNVTSNFRQGGWGYTTDSGVHWTFPGVLENNVFRSDPVTKSDETGNFFYLSFQSNVQQSFFCDDLWRSTNGGQSWTLLSGERGAGGGDKDGLQSTRRTGRDMDFNIRQTTALTAAGAACNFNGPPMAASRGRRRLVFLTRRYMEPSTWTPMATSMSAAKGTPFTVSAPATHKSGAKHQLLIGAPR